MSQELLIALSSELTHRQGLLSQYVKGAAKEQEKIDHLMEQYQNTVLAMQGKQVEPPKPIQPAALLTSKKNKKVRK
jgi:hypothetical protein